MNNPYEVLGIDKNATEDEINIAYRNLVKKYHPDKYINNPLADLAAEKMREINEAYDYLTKNKSQSGSSGSGSTGTSGSGSLPPALGSATISSLPSALTATL